MRDWTSIFGSGADKFFGFIAVMDFTKLILVFLIASLSNLRYLIGKDYAGNQSKVRKECT